MQIVTVRLDEDLVDDLDAEAEEHGFSNRTEYIRNLLRNRERIQENTPENTSDYDERLTGIEERLSALEAEITENTPRQNDVIAQNTRESAVSGGGGDRMEHLAGDDSAAGVSGGDREDTASDDDERREAAAAHVRDHFGDGGPQKEHVRRAVVAVVQHLATEGACKTATLKDVVMEVAGDHYAERRNAWNSINRYVADVPGVHKPDYGMWAYEPDDDGGAGVYDPTDEF